MSSEKPKGTCSNERCRLIIDLTDYRIKITDTPKGGIVTCPYCGGIAYLSPEITAQAFKNRNGLRG